MNTPQLIIPPCIFRLPGNLILFAEDVDLSGDEIVFDLEHAAVLTFAPMPDGKSMGIMSQKASEALVTFGSPTIRVNKSAIVIQSTNNLDLLDNARKVIHKIEIARGPHR
jgi:hypothetical protein